MDEFRARRVVDALRDRGVNAHLLRGVSQFGVRVSLPGGREAEWDTDGTAGLEAQVMRDGMLVGYVPQIEGSETFNESQVVEAIAVHVCNRDDVDPNYVCIGALGENAHRRGEGCAGGGTGMHEYFDSHRVRERDIGGAIGLTGMGLMVIVFTLKNTIRLYREERIPQ